MRNPTPPQHAAVTPALELVRSSKVMNGATRRWCCRLVGWLVLVAGWWAEPAGAQPVWGPSGWAATFNWSIGTGPTVLLASTNTTVTCTVDVSMTGDPYNPPTGTVSCAPTILNSLGLAAGSTTVLTNVDYSPYWAQYVCVFTLGDYGDMTLQVDVGNNTSSRTVTAVKLDNITFSPDQTIAVSNSVTMTASVLPASFVGTFIWGSITNSTGAVVTVTLDYGGPIPASVTLAETGETLWTEVIVISPTLTAFPSNDPGFVGDETGFGVLVQNDEGLPHTVTWSGAVSGTDNPATYTPTGPGTSTATATVTVGPWTGSATGEQKVYRWSLLFGPDDAGNVTNSFALEGPDGACFLAEASFPDEYDFAQWIGAGTNVFTMHLSRYDIIEYDLDEDSGDETNLDDPLLLTPGELDPATPPPTPTPAAPRPPKIKITSNRILQGIGLIADLIAITQAVSQKSETVTKPIVDELITIPGSVMTTYNLDGGYWYNPDTGGLEAAPTTDFPVTVSAAGSTISRRKFDWSTWYHVGTVVSQVSANPVAVRLQRGNLLSPRSARPLLSALMVVNGTVEGDSFGPGTPAVALQQTSGLAMNSVNFRILAGSKIKVGCHAEIALPMDGSAIRHFDTGTTWVWGGGTQMVPPIWIELRPPLVEY